MYEKVFFLFLFVEYSILYFIYVLIDFANQTFQNHDLTDFFSCLPDLLIIEH